MNSSSISKAMNKNKQSIMEFDHYIAFDWSQENVALARMARKAAEPKVIEWDKSDIKAIKEYLSHLRGTIIASPDSFYRGEAIPILVRCRSLRKNARDVY